MTRRVSATMSERIVLTDMVGVKAEGQPPAAMFAGAHRGTGRGEHPAEGAVAGANNGSYNSRACASTQVGIVTPALRIL